MKFSHGDHRLALGPEGARGSRVEEGFVAPGAELGAPPEVGEEPLGDALRVEEDRDLPCPEVLGACAAHGEHRLEGLRRRPRIAPVSAALEDPPHFEGADLVHLPCAVDADRAQQGRQEVCAQHRVAGLDRILEGNMLPTRVVGRKTQAIVVLRRAAGEGHDLREASPDQTAADRLRRTPARRNGDSLQTCTREGRLDAVVAMHPCDLFDVVGFEVQVTAIDGRCAAKGIPFGDGLDVDPREQGPPCRPE